jgi:hypothetical protein
MAPSNSPFVAPIWLRCACCVVGMLPLLFTSIAELLAPCLSNALSLTGSVFLFRFCLYTLITGTPPNSVLAIVGDLRKGQVAAKETQRAEK